jgi:hypothetical protein
MYDRDARTSIAALDPETGELTDLDLPYDALRGPPGIAASGSTIVFIEGSATRPSDLVWLDFTGPGRSM